MEIKFDNEKINTDYYMAISNEYTLFSDTFYLGSTPSNLYDIKINKKAIANSDTKNITIEHNEKTIATLVIDDSKEDKESITYTLSDKMLDFEFNYNAKPLIDNSETGSVSLLEILEDICNQANVINGVSTIENDINVNWYDNTITAREYIGYIAELQASYAYIDEMGVLRFSKHKKEVSKIINFDELGDYEIGDYHKISRVVYEVGAVKYEFGDDTYNTLYIDVSNPFVVNEGQIEFIYENIVDFEFYSFTTNECKIYFDEVKAGDIIIFTDGINSYPTIAQYSISYFGGWTGGYSLEIKSTKQENTDILGNEEKFKRLKIEVDRDLNRITQKIEETSNYNNEQLSQMSQNINGFNFTIKDIQNNVSNLENTFKITIGGIEGVIDKTGNNLLYGTSLYDLSEWGHIFDSEEQINDVEVLNNDYTKSNFLSERAMNVNYTTFKSTIVDKNMKSLTLSMKVLNNLEMGYFNINVNERVNKEIINQINTDIYNDDYKSLDKFTITFPITNSDGVSFDGILQTKPILIGIDGYSIINEIEPTPKKGLYWIKESTDEIRRAKYNNDEFQNWELIPWTYTQAKNNPTLVDGISVPTIPTKGNIMIGDIKLEYGDMASDWSLNPNEFYGTNYKITEDGIEFQKGNEKTIHNEEGINIYKDNDLKTQINSEKVFSEKAECKELNVDGLITKKVGINEYIRFMRE